MEYQVGDKVEFQEFGGGWWGPFTVESVHDYGTTVSGEPWVEYTLTNDEKGVFRGGVEAARMQPISSLPPRVLKGTAS